MLGEGAEVGPDERKRENMKCGHCKASGPSITVEHVWTCAQHGNYAAPAPAPAAKVATLADEPVEGVYKDRNGTLYKVVESQNGHFYARAWQDTVGAGDLAWEYAGRRPLYHLTAADRLTAEDAAKFGHLTGQCVFCARRLTDERSIAVGYGPVCAEREGLPWGGTSE